MSVLDCVSPSSGAKSRLLVDQSISGNCLSRDTDSFASPSGSSWQPEQRKRRRVQGRSQFGVSSGKYPLSQKRVKQQQRLICFFQGSAAACRGSSSTQISNDVAKYLIQLALLGETQDPFESSKKVIFASSSQIQIVMELAAASAYGAMISVDAGGPFWKQRLMYLTMKEVIVVSFSHDVEDSMFWGQLALVTQVVACGNVSALSETALTLLADVLVKDLLLMYPRKANDELAHLIATPDVMVLQELVLAGIIKLMGSPTAKMPKYTGALVPAMLRILSRENKSGSKALVLQILCIVCSFENEKAAILTLKPAVESVLLKILDDPSSIFRQMVAETRNYWAVVT